MKKNVLSLFDGMSCAQIVLDALKIEIDKYFASEVDPTAMKVALHNYPDTIHVGDVRDINTKSLPPIWLIAAGSPCTDLSIAGKMKGFLGIKSLDDYIKKKNSGYDFGDSQSYLFFEFLRLVKELKPKYFFLENVVLKGKMKKYEKFITEALGVEPIRINSSSVCAQNRDRLYWTNIPGITIPKDRGIKSYDVIPNGFGAGKRGVKVKDSKISGKKYEQKLTVRTDFKFNCLVTSSGNTNLVYFPNGEHRVLTIQECEVLQTLPKGYTNVPNVSETQKRRMIGNGWTIEVIKHLFKPLKKLGV